MAKKRADILKASKKAASASPSKLAPRAVEGKEPALSLSKGALDEQIIALQTSLDDLERGVDTPVHRSRNADGSSASSGSGGSLPSHGGVGSLPSQGGVGSLPTQAAPPPGHSEPRSLGRGEESLTSMGRTCLTYDRKVGWGRLAKSLKAELDEESIAQYRETVSLPFVMSPSQRAAIKIIDDRGIESMKVMEG